MFTGCKFLMMNRCFKVYFSYIFGGMFFICLWGYEFQTKKREMISKMKKVTFVTFVTLVIYFVRNSYFMC